MPIWPKYLVINFLHLIIEHRISDSVLLDVKIFWTYFKNHFLLKIFYIQ